MGLLDLDHNGIMLVQGLMRFSRVLLLRVSGPRTRDVGMGETILYPRLSKSKKDNGIWVYLVIKCDRMTDVETRWSKKMLRLLTSS